MPKRKRAEVVSDKCRGCAIFGSCKGRVLPPDEFCLGYKDKRNTFSEKKKIPSDDVLPPNNETIFKSRANNGSICDDCRNEFDGMCRLTWSVALYKIKECVNFKLRTQNEEAV